MFINSNLLSGKKILLGVSGSIAVYKSLELVRLFVKAGAEVRVVMSSASKKFVTSLSFETLTSNLVLDDENESWANNHNHIKITQWADLFVIAPATTNTIAKLANAISDNMLLQCALAYSGIKILAPSANTNMLEHPITQANLKILGITNYEILDTLDKDLACQTKGKGAMSEPIDIFYAGARELLKDEFYKDRRVVVTAGGTIEKIDDIRYLSNFSSGKMGSALATALYLKGADVNLIATNFESNIPLKIHTIDVKDSAEMAEYLEDSVRVSKKAKLSKPSLVKDEYIHLIQKKPYLFMSAAVSDYIPSFAQSGKLKKDILGNTFDLKLKLNNDILKSVNKEGIITVGFKAEIDEKDAFKNASNMIETKNLDAVCLNILKDSSSFGSDDIKMQFIDKGKKSVEFYGDKLSVAFEILENAKSLD